MGILRPWRGAHRLISSGPLAGKAGCPEPYHTPLRTPPNQASWHARAHSPPRPFSLSSHATRTVLCGVQVRELKQVSLVASGCTGVLHNRATLVTAKEDALKDYDTKNAEYDTAEELVGEQLCADRPLWPRHRRLGQPRPLEAPPRCQTKPQSSPGPRCESA